MNFGKGSMTVPSLPSGTSVSAVTSIPNENLVETEHGNNTDSDSSLCSSVAGAYSIWAGASPLDTLKRGLLSILGWITGFALSIVLYRKITRRNLPT